ncbi:type I-C CRISPR-associated protein Cas8c/Csd1 [uncultured Alloprevotella sp.]|uniref:type I-C CRISPR-associated protein Cas8c/Csd1 n=1 Tax=uncultured Alloprevotella sp. TaxID=1283315 RepID=UPI00325FDF75
MILKALYDYYQRKSEELPAFGCELKEIGFILVIDKDGNFLRFEDRRIDKKNASSFLVKKHVGRSSAPIANLLYDNCSYILGYSTEGDIDSNAKYISVFKAKVEELYTKLPNNSAVSAIWKFYQKNPAENLLKVQADPLWPEIEKNLNKKYSTFSFLLEGETTIVAAQKDVINADEEKEGNEKEQLCLITGNHGKAVDVTTATMIAGSQATAKLVAFQVNSGYDSYGKQKGFNAPISQKAEFAYTTALNHILSANSRNKFLVGNRTYLFWGSSNSNGNQETESSIFAMFGFNDSEEEDPNARIYQIRKVFEGIYSGSIKTDLNDRFYIAGLAPNAARIAIVYWAELPLKEFAHTILRHFEDMDIVDTRKEKKPYMGLKSILATVTLGGKSSEATPNLPDAVIKSIFQGLPYPDTLYHSCLRRIRAEQSVSITRAAILKAYLNRKNTNQKPIQIMLDKENTNQGYLCGRLFAVIDKLQNDANHIHSIRERYMNAASSTPATVFATILNLSAIHANNLNNEGSRIFYDKLKQEIISKINADGFPSHLDLQDQGRFFVGYYQQMQSFFLTETKQTEE